MKIAIFGANGPTGRIMVEDGMGRGFDVVAVTRHPEEFPLHGQRLTVVRADVTEGAGLVAAIGDCDAVASLLGSPYSRKPIIVYSRGTRAIVAAMKEVGCTRLVVVSAGLAYPPESGHRFFLDKIIFPFLRGVIGRTLYADMRAMEEFLRSVQDLEWTVIRPGRLVKGDTRKPYITEPERSIRTFTTRRDLAKAMLDLIENGTHVHQAVAVTSR